MSVWCFHKKKVQFNLNYGERNKLLTNTVRSPGTKLRGNNLHYPYTTRGLIVINPNNKLVNAIPAPIICGYIRQGYIQFICIFFPLNHNIVQLFLQKLAGCGCAGLA